MRKLLAFASCVLLFWSAYWFAVQIKKQAATPSPEASTLPARAAQQVSSPDDVQPAFELASLRLFAVSPSGKQALGSALMGFAPEDARVFRVGDPVVRGALLHAVERDHVLLRVGPSFTRLELIQSKQLPARQAQALALAPGTVSGTGALPIPATQISNFDISAQIMTARFEQTAEGAAGLRVTPGLAPQAFRQLGLNPGDMITALNGASINNEADATAALARLTERPDISFVIVRGGHTVTYSVNAASVLREIILGPTQSRNDNPNGGLQ